MTIGEFIVSITRYQDYVLYFFIGLPILTIIYGFVHGKDKGNCPPHRYLYALIIYLACIPGVFSFVLTAYSLLFLRENLLDVNFFIYFLPLISMTVTLAAMRRRVNFTELPGFDRLFGFIVVLLVTFIIAFILGRMRFWVIFGGSISALIVFVVLLFLIVKYAAHKLFYGSKN